MSKPAISLPPLFPHQVRAGTAVRDAYKRGYRRILVVLPTGAGKTIFACSIAESAINLKGRRALWLTHRRELVDQASQSLTRAGVPHGVVLSGRSQRPDLPMQVASVQTLTAAGRAPEANILFIDEAHHIVASTWRTIIEAYPAIELIVGLTATPERGDKSPLGDVFQTMIVGATIAELTKLGFLVPCDVDAPARYLEKGLAKDPLDEIDRKARRPDGSLRRTILFAASVPEAKELAAKANARGIRAACVDGTTHVDERARALAAFARGELDLITNVYCLTEGFDCPGVEVIVLARGCSSAATFLQMIGRGLRLSAGKTRALLIDLRGVVWLHGMPDDDRVFSLTGKAIQIAAALPSLRQCTGCGATFRPVPACPRCGRRQPPPPPQRIRDVAVERVTSGQVAASFGERRKFFEDLVAEARSKRTPEGRPYSPTWVRIRYKHRFGAWPPWPIQEASRA